MSYIIFINDAILVNQVSYIEHHYDQPALSRPLAAVSPGASGVLDLFLVCFVLAGRSIRRGRIVEQATKAHVLGLIHDAHGSGLRLGLALTLGAGSAVVLVLVAQAGVRAGLPKAVVPDTIPHWTWCEARWPEREIEKMKKVLN